MRACAGRGRPISHKQNVGRVGHDMNVKPTQRIAEYCVDQSINEAVLSHIQ